MEKKYGVPLNILSSVFEISLLNLKDIYPLSLVSMLRENMLNVQLYQHYTVVCFLIFSLVFQFED